MHALDLLALSKDFKQYLAYYSPGPASPSGSMLMEIAAGHAEMNSIKRERNLQRIGLFTMTA